MQPATKHNFAHKFLLAPQRFVENEFGVWERCRHPRAKGEGAGKRAFPARRRGLKIRSAQVSVSAPGSGSQLGDAVLFGYNLSLMGRRWCARGP
jgi:hypothetical protein